MTDSTPAIPAPVPAPNRSTAAAALSDVDSLADRPLAEHVEVFTAVHDALAGQLSAAEA